MSILSPFGWLYGRIADLRNTLYDKGVFESVRLGARTISIGNITAGGTGKTPLVAYVAEILAGQGERVCILTRGYGRENARRRVLVSDGEQVMVDAKTGGDEPVELARKLLEKAVVVADANRVAAASWAKEKFGITAFVLDDAFQHRRVKHDLDIVCIDATNPFGNGLVLPAGNLREPLGNLSRADAVVITRANLAENISNLRSEISKHARNSKVLSASNKIARLSELKEFHAKTQSTKRSDQIQNPRSEIPNRKSLAFCGLGNPSNFFKQLSSEGFDIVAKKPFPDHHFYNQEDVLRLEKKARASGSEILLTTAKDAVKLRNLKFEIPCFVVETEMVFDDEPGFRFLITAASS